MADNKQGNQDRDSRGRRDGYEMKIVMGTIAM